MHVIDCFLGVELATVEEEAGSSPPDFNVESDVHLHRSTSNDSGSAISGTTNFHVETMRDDAARLLELLPTIASSSFDIMTELQSKVNSGIDNANITSALLAPESNFEALFNLFRDSFEPYSTDEHWSNSDHVLQALIPDAASQGSSSLQRSFKCIFAVANLAKLMNDIMLLENHDDNLVLLLQTIENMFPRPFLQSFKRRIENFSPGSTHLISETLDALVLIRTHLVIAVLKSQATATSDPDIVLQTVLLKPWDIDNFPGITKGDIQIFSDKTVKRANEIRQSYMHDNESLEFDDLVDFIQLESAFPWDSLGSHLGNWVLRRVEEINSQCESAGGIRQMAIDLQEQIRAWPTKEVAVGIEEQQDFDSSTVAKDSAIAFIRNSRRSLRTRVNGALTGLATAHQTSSQSRRPGTLENIETLLDKENQSRVDKGTSLKSAKPSFMDPQSNAIKIPPIASSENDDFQQDSRTVTNSRRRIEPVKVSRTTSKRQPEPQSPESAQIPSKRVRRDNLEDEEYNPVSRNQQEEAVEDANLADDQITERGVSQATSTSGVAAYRVLSEATLKKREEQKERTDIIRANKAARRGQRIAWSEDENDALIKAIGKYGCKWSRIKDMDTNHRNILELRDQGDLKDRARNLKYEFLRYGTTSRELGASICG